MAATKKALRLNRIKAAYEQGRKDRYTRSISSVRYKDIEFNAAWERGWRGEPRGK